MNIDDFLHKLNTTPEQLHFHETLAAIDENYHYSATAFKNGSLFNQAGENEGSCKLFAFAQKHRLNQQQTLNCFAQYYRNDVLTNPQGNDHHNIRNFMQNGWDGIEFTDTALTRKN